MKSVIWSIRKIWYTIVSSKMEEATWKGMWWPLKAQHGLQSVQLLSCVWFFVTPWTAAHQASLSITNSWSFLKTHVLTVSDAIQPSHPLLSPSPPALNLSYHQGLFQWVSSFYAVAKVLEFQLQHQYFQWIFRSSVNSQQGNRGFSPVILGTEFCHQ